MHKTKLSIATVIFLLISTISANATLFTIPVWASNSRSIDHYTGTAIPICSGHAILRLYEVNANYGDSVYISSQIGFEREEYLWPHQDESAYWVQTYLNRAASAAQVESNWATLYGCYFAPEVFHYTLDTPFPLWITTSTLNATVPTNSQTFSYSGYMYIPWY